MKNLPIKFRAKNIRTGEYVYGDFIQSPVDVPVIRVWNAEECKNGFYAYDDYEIYPDSVSQLVGYDAAGNEVYEGDWIKLEGNTTDVVQVRWDNNHTCVAVSWNNGLSDSYGSVFNHYDRKPFLVEVDDNE